MAEDKKREEYLELFLNEIKNKNYQEAFKYFQELDLDSEYREDNNFYLFMMSQIIKVPEEYKNRIYNMGFKDISKSSDKNIGEGKVKYQAFAHKFSQAKKTYMYLEDNSIRGEVMVELLSRATEVLTEVNKYALNLIERGKYEELVSMYKGFSKDRPLCRFEKLIIVLGAEVNNIVSKGILPRVMLGPSRGMEDDVVLRNYEMAFKKMGKRSETNLIYVLLREINREVEKRKVDFSDVVKVFNNGEANEIKKVVGYYLRNRECPQYIRFINDLITIGVYEGDYNFSEAFTKLSCIEVKQGEVLVDMTSYVEKFYEAISLGNIAEAKIYLDIVSQSKSLTGTSIDVLDMKRILYKTTVEFSSDNSFDKYTLLGDVIEEIKDTKGLRILEKLNDEDKRAVVRIVSKFPNIMVEEIDEKLVLRYHDIFEESPDFHKLKEEGNEAFKRKEYDKTIECYNRICTKLMSPTPEVFQKIGTSYLRRGNGEEDYRRAIDYLTVAKAKGKAVDEKIKEARKKIDYTGVKIMKYTKE